MDYGGYIYTYITSPIPAFKFTCLTAAPPGVPPAVFRGLRGTSSLKSLAFSVKFRGISWILGVVLGRVALYAKSSGA
jgi:hypothetical protein